jgi:hypothetical protein
MSVICYEFTIFFVTNMSLICAAGTLNPCGHYVSGMGLGQLNALRTTFERMTDLDTAAALSEAQTFCAKAGSFSCPLAQKMTVDGKTSPGMHFLQLHFIATGCINLETYADFSSFPVAWWQMFGYSTPALQKLAMRLVSQCASATGCERN